jgi:pimeloyl-ACP methyl ester carboxylesterase
MIHDFLGGRSALIGAILSLAVSSATAEDSPPLWGDLVPGPYAVGFRAIFTVDNTRAYYLDGGSEYRGRPLRILVWYPGQTLETDRMSFGGYFKTPPPDPIFNDFHAALMERELSTAHRQFSPPDSGASFQAMMNARTVAHRDLPFRPGGYPLVVHSLGRNDYQEESTVLWEYLASHGYVVAVVPQVGPHEENPGLSFTPPDIETQCRDVEFTLATMLRWPNVESGKTALVGHSSGGVVSTLVAARNPNIDAVVSFEGSISTTDGEVLLREMDWNPDDLTVPVLNLFAKGKRDLSLAVLDTLAGSDRYHGAFGTGEPPGLATHFDFQNWPLYSVLTGMEDSRGVSWRPASTGAKIYLGACRVTLMFLDGVIRGDEAALVDLRGSSVPGIPEAIATFSYEPRQ